MDCLDLLAVVMAALAFGNTVVITGWTISAFRSTSGLH
jgi:hypothetical protein